MQSGLQRRFPELLLLLQAGQAVVRVMEVHQSTGLLLVFLHNSGKHLDRK